MTTLEAAQRRPVLQFSGVIYVLIAALGFSSKGVLIKLAYALHPYIDAISVMAVRMLFALPFFLFVAARFARSADTPKLESQDTRSILVLGFFGYYISSYLDFKGLEYISANLERLILYLYPTLVVVISAYLYQRAIPPRERGALALGYLGIALVFVIDLHANGTQVLTGGALVFAAAISYAVFLIRSEHTIRRVGAARFTAYSMSVATLLTLIHYVAQHATALLHLPAMFYLIGGVMALFCTVIPAFLMNLGLQRIGAGPTAIISSAGPVMTLGLAYAVLHEAVGAVQILGAALILASVFIVSRRA